MLPAARDHRRPPASPDPVGTLIRNESRSKTRRAISSRSSFVRVPTETAASSPSVLHCLTIPSLTINLPVAMDQTASRNTDREEQRLDTGKCVFAQASADGLDAARSTRDRPRHLRGRVVVVIPTEKPLTDHSHPLASADEDVKRAKPQADWHVLIPNSGAGANIAERRWCRGHSPRFRTGECWNRSSSSE